MLIEYHKAMQHFFVLSLKFEEFIQRKCYDSNPHERHDIAKEGREAITTAHASLRRLAWFLDLAFAQRGFQDKKN
jgi:hypothetical protein